MKVITGIRRCGKSSLLRLMAQHLRESGVAPEQVIELNFESMALSVMSNRQFYQYVKDRVIADKTMYLFLDEVQRIDDWQAAVNSFMVDFPCDIYITGSNAFLLSSELSTYLSGRYVEIKMYPLSFREFIDFHGYTLGTMKAPDGSMRKRVFNEEGDSYEPRDLFGAYLKYGGMPALADIGLEQDKVIVMNDVINFYFFIFLFHQCNKLCFVYWIVLSWSQEVNHMVFQQSKLKKRDWMAYIPLLLCAIFWSVRAEKGNGLSPTRFCCERSSCFWRTTSAITLLFRPSEIF